MAKITKEQKSALEAKGYTVKGDTVLSSKGTVGGYNANGKLFSGSGVVAGILKKAPEKPSMTPLATSTPKSKVRASGGSPTKPTGVSEPKAKGAPVLEIKTTKLGPAPKPRAIPARPVNPTPAKVRLQQKHTQVTSEIKTTPGLNFAEWKRMYAGKQFAPGEALKLYGEYKRNSSK